MQSNDDPISARMCQEARFSVPLCVELEPGLLRGQPVWEGLLAFVQQAPLRRVGALLWSVRGPAFVLAQLRRHQAFDGVRFAYDWALLDALNACHKQGRQVILLSQSETDLSAEVSRQLGLFTSTLALKSVGSDRAKQLSEHFPDGFDYVAARPFETTPAGQVVFQVGASKGAAEQDQEGVVATIRQGWFAALVRLARPHQWAKNALLAVPLLLAPGLPGFGKLLDVAVAILAFSFCASAGYVLNDLLDLEADRAHHSKRHRPLANGTLSILAAIPLFLGLMAAAFLVAVTALPPTFGALLMVYFVGTVTYSLYLKRIVLVDVLVLAGLYTHRILAGGVATKTDISTWLLAFSMFLFTSLAFVKRFVELQRVQGDSRVKNRGYWKVDSNVVLAMGAASGNIAALVYVLYVDSASVRANYSEPAILWLLLPILLYWLGRVWMLAGRGKMQDDPVRFALKDRNSILCCLTAAALILAARFPPVSVVHFLGSLR